MKYNTNINYNTLNATELYTYACKPFESGSQVIDTFLNNNGHSFSSYSVVTSSFTENEYWAESPNNSLPTMSVSPYSGVCGLHFQQKYFVLILCEERATHNPKKKRKRRRRRRALVIELNHLPHRVEDD